MSNISVFMEVHNNQLRNVSLQLLTAGQQLAADAHEELVAVIVGNQNDAIIEQLVEYPIDRVVSLEHFSYENYATDSYTDALYAYVCEYQPQCFLFGTTFVAKDLVPRLAARCKTGLTAECTSVSYQQDTGKILWSRTGFGGKMMADIVCPDRLPQMGTIREGVYRKPKTRKGHLAKIVHWDMSEHIKAERVRILQKTSKVLSTQQVDYEPEIVVGLGRGVRTLDRIDIVMDFADALNAGLGASRGAVEMRLLPDKFLIGQNGRNLHPKIYIACGISGAAQHMAGISGADCVIAINSDPNAPIFKVADYGICGDLHKVIPEFLKLMQSDLQKSL